MTLVYVFNTRVLIVLSTSFPLYPNVFRAEVPDSLNVLIIGLLILSLAETSKYLSISWY